MSTSVQTACLQRCLPLLCKRSLIGPFAICYLQHSESRSFTESGLVTIKLSERLATEPEYSQLNNILIVHIHLERKVAEELLSAMASKSSPPISKYPVRIISLTLPSSESKNSSQHNQSKKAHRNGYFSTFFYRPGQTVGKEGTDADGTCFV